MAKRDKLWLISGSTAIGQPPLAKRHLTREFSRYLFCRHTCDHFYKRSAYGCKFALAAKLCLISRSPGTPQALQNGVGSAKLWLILWPTFPLGDSPPSMSFHTASHTPEDLEPRRKWASLGVVLPTKLSKAAAMNFLRGASHCEGLGGFWCGCSFFVRFWMIVPARQSSC